MTQDVITNLRRGALSILQDAIHYTPDDPLCELLNGEMDIEKYILINKYRSGISWTFGICECCGRDCRLEKHHWFEPPSLECHIKMICRDCNMSLTTDAIYGGLFSYRNLPRWNHILPRWALQLAYATTSDSSTRKAIRETIKKELGDFQPPDDW